MNSKSFLFEYIYWSFIFVCFIILLCIAPTNLFALHFSIIIVVFCLFLITSILKRAFSSSLLSLFTILIAFSALFFVNYTTEGFIWFEENIYSYVYSTIILATLIKIFIYLPSLKNKNKLKKISLK